MKNLQLTVSLSLFLAAASFGATLNTASASDSYCGPLVWAEVKALARDCATKIQSGGKCANIKLYSTRAAAFYLGGALYRVRMEESAFADDGDLNDLYVERDDGCQLQRKNVPAFGNIINALAR